MDQSRENFRPLDASGILSWVHFGDLHLTVEQARNYQDFLALIAEANTHLAGLDGVNFAVLPGDNADAGTESQFILVRRAIDGLQLPVHALPGDHDIQSGSLGWFRGWLEPVLPRSFVAGGYRCVFLNSVEIKGTKGFGLGRRQFIEVRARAWNALGDIGRVLYQVDDGDFHLMTLLAGAAWKWG